MTNQGRLNAEVLNALGSKGEYIMFATIYETVRQVPDLVDVTQSEVRQALVGMMNYSGIWTEVEPGKGWRKAVTPDPEPAPLETDQMGQGVLENRALDIFRAIAASGETGGPALVRLASDLDTMIRSASFPRLTATVTLDPDAGPEDADEFGNPATIVQIGCPVCGDDDVNTETVYVIDSATRWTAAESFEITFDPAPGQALGFASFEYDGDSDFAGSGYYLHDSGKPHPVSLPEGWTEMAL
jgi:hypothetical protein